MPKRSALIPEDIEDLFDDYGNESFVKKAIIELVANHREEYDELAGNAIEKEVEKLELTVSRQRLRIQSLEQLNPKRVNVPSLSETANKLQKRIEELEDSKPKKKGRRRF